MPKIVDHDERRDEVAAVAARVLASSGLGSSTIRDVAAAGGWSTTMVTHYFANKDALLTHTLMQSVAEMVEGIEAAQRDGGDELASIIELILPLDDERIRRWRLWLAFWGSAVGSDELSALQRERQEGLVALLSAALERRGHLTGHRELMREARRLVALLDGVSVQAVFAPDQWPARRQLEHFADVLSDRPS